MCPIRFHRLRANWHHKEREKDELIVRDFQCKGSVFQRCSLRIPSGNRLTDRISNNNLYEKCGSIPLYRAIMRERLTQTRSFQRGVEVTRKDLVKNWTSLKSIERENLTRMGWERSVSSFVGLRRLDNTLKS